MSLRASYTLFAPLYDAVVDTASRDARRESLRSLPQQGALDVLIAGVGTGLDLPWLPAAHRYVGLDLTRAMLSRARGRSAGLSFSPIQGDVQQMPFSDARFDCAVLHLILAVVPDPARCLAETARVTRPGGTILVLDKFLRPNQAARLRRLINPITRRLATRLDVVFEPLIEQVGGLSVEADEPALAGGWFRRIRVRRA